MSQEDYSNHLEKMIREISVLSEKTADEIKKEAEAKYQEIINEAKAEAAKLESEISNKAESDARQNVKRDVSKKKLSIQMDYLNLRENIIEGVLANIRKELQKLTKDKSYSDLLTNMAKEALVAINGGDLEILLRSEDKGLFTDAKLKELTSSIDVETKLSLSNDDLKTIGGLIVKRKDGLVSVDNTFEKIIERKKDEIRQVIVSELLN